MARFLVFLLLAGVFTGCSTEFTTARSHLKTYADATNVSVYEDGKLVFHADTLNHTEPTKAAMGGVSTIAGTVGGAAAGVILSGGALH